jgi:hypothetical protein
VLWPLNFSLSYDGFTVLRPRCFGVQSEMRHRSPEGLRALLASYVAATRERMRTIDDISILHFNGWDDWENAQLRPGVPGHSLFMRAHP